MTTIALESNPSYFSKIKATDVGETVWVAPRGFANQAFMTGKDGHRYILGCPAETTVVVVDANTGSHKTLSTTQIRTDMVSLGLPAHTTAMTQLSVPGKPYFWVIGWSSTTLAYTITAIMYRIDDIDTLTPVSGLNEVTVWDVDKLERLGVESGVGVGVVGDEVWSMHQLTSRSISGPGRVGILKLPLTEGFLSKSGDFMDRVTHQTQLDYDFFNYLDHNRTGKFGAAFLSTGQYLVYVDKGSYDYMAANSSTNTVWAALTGPALLLCDPSDGSYTDITSSIDFSDAMKHKDGTASTSTYDDYITPNTFVIGNTDFVAFCRPYSSTTDLGTTGMWCRIKVYKFDGTTWTQEYDQQASLFDMVSDLGVSASKKDNYPADVLQVYPDTPDGSTANLHYMYARFSGGSDLQTYAFGKAADITITLNDIYLGTFASIHDDNYKDWKSTNNFGWDFDAYFTTYYMLSSNSYVFMEAPWIKTFLDDTGSSSSLLMQPIWDWCEDTGSVKYGPTVECYKTRSGQLVLDAKHRIRGKGRALQLKFTATSGKPFSILGWSINIDSNTGP